MSNAPSWVTDHHEVRLFPSVHIRGEEEAELRAAASLLSVIRAVSEFGRTFVGLAGGIASKTSRFSCYTEVPLKLRVSGKKPKELRPDGVIVATRGKTQWIAFVEIKVGKTDLEQDQLENYLLLAKQERVDALITVSHQAAQADDSPPVEIRGRRRFPMVHFSWERLLSEAQHLSEQKAISDPDQKWTLDEWIRYVNDDASGIVSPPELGPRWSEVLKAARANTLEQSQEFLQDVARHWVGYLRKAAFKLRADLGVDVEVHMTRAERRDTSIQAENSVNAQEGTLSGTLRIQDAAGDIRLEVDLRSRVVRYTMSVAAPTEGLQKTRIRWVAKHLRSKEDLAGLDGKINVDWEVRGLSTEARLSDYLDDSSVICNDKDDIPVGRNTQPRSFKIICTRTLTRGRGRSSAPILEGISEGLRDYYHSIVQNIKPYQRKPARLAITQQGQENSPSIEDGPGATANESGDVNQEPSTEE